MELVLVFLEYPIFFSLLFSLFFVFWFYFFGGEASFDLYEFMCDMSWLQRNMSKLDFRFSKGSLYSWFYLNIRQSTEAKYFFHVACGLNSHG